MTEKQALRELKHGSQKALEYMIRTYGSYVNAVLYHTAGHLSAADREEAAADVFLALWNQAETIQFDRVKAWLGAVARNTACNLCRSYHQEQSLDDDILVELPDLPEDQLLRQEMETQLHNAIGNALISLPQPDREICLRRFYYGQSLADIANELNLNLSTVKSKLYRGRDKLKHSLEETMKKEDF